MRKMSDIEELNEDEKVGKTGLVVGKFYPPHHGHDFLIDTAAKKSEKLDVIVIARPDESIPGELRAKWVAKNHPNANVILRPDTLTLGGSDRWADQTISWLGRAPDVVFSSEDYGQAYARFMGSRHYLVDRARSIVPMSGTKVRNNPLENLEFLEPNVRSYFVKRVCILGAESTGTTTISKALAKHYDTVWVPEFGRDYSEVKLARGEHDWQSWEFELIAREQQAAEDAAAGVANKVLICDTNAFATEIWHERYMGEMSGEVAKIGEASKADLYIVTGDEIPFVQDGLRDGENIRHAMHRRFIDELRNRQLPFVVLRGSKEERLVEAENYIDSMLVARPN
jgi:HTH-type transcriptional repressor of NAD biosynthesis genes